MLRSLKLSLVSCVAGLLAWLGAVVSLSAQDSATSGVKLQPGIGWSGVGFYAPQEWGIIRSSILNESPTELNAMLTLTTKASGSVQFAKEVWLPSNSRLDTFTPVRLDKLPSASDRGVGGEAMLLPQGGGAPLAREEGMLNVRQGSFETAVISGEGGEGVTALSAALRESAGLPPATAYIGGRNAPAFAPAWDAISLLVIGDPNLNFDPAQLEAVRQFVFGGGRLWVDLTRVDPGFMSRLLGEDWNVTVVDRIGMTDFAIEGPGAQAAQPPRVTVDYPIDLVRVIAPDMETLHSVNGYPASLRKAVGRGTLLVTTLESAAWLDAQRKAGPSLRSMSWLVRSSMADTSAPDARADVLRAVASEQIGYSIIGRVPVAVVLGVFALALLAVGIFLTKRGDLAPMGWLAPVLAVLAAAALLGFGLARQSQVPFTLASAEILEAAPGSPYAQSTNMVSVYRPTGGAGDAAALAGEGEPAWPDLRTHGGKNVRIVWTGERSWRYDNLEFSPGAVQTAQRQTITHLPRPLVARAEVDAQGLRGTVDLGDLGTLEDAVILTPYGKVTVKLGGEGAFTAAAADPLGPGQYFEGAVLGQRQMARQDAYRRLVSDPRFVERPVLAGWVENTTGRIGVSDEAVRQARSLVVLPLELTTPKPGSAVALPAPLLRMRPYRGMPDMTSAPIYDERTREWVPTVSNPQTTLMGFDVPDAIRAMNVTTARLTIDLTAPGRPYEVLIVQNDALRSVKSGESPVGLQTLELTGADAPQPRADGAIVVGVRVGEPVDPAVVESWSLKRMELSVVGTAE